MHTPAHPVFLFSFPFSLLFTVCPLNSWKDDLTADWCVPAHFSFFTNIRLKHVCQGSNLLTDPPHCVLLGHNTANQVTGHVL